jgi:hypothetical protein
MDESYAHRVAEAFKGKNTSREDLKADEADSWCMRQQALKLGIGLGHQR